MIPRTEALGFGAPGFADEVDSGAEGPSDPIAPRAVAVAAIALPTIAVVREARASGGEGSAD